MLLSCLIVSTWLFAFAADADEVETFFITPPSPSTTTLFIADVLLVLNTQYTVSWSTNLTTYGIYLWQQGLGLQDDTATPYSDAIYTVASGQPGQVTSFNWTVAPEIFSLEASPVFFFALATGPALNVSSATCHYFNITTQAQATTSTLPPSTSSSPTATSSPPAATSSSASAAPTSSKGDDGLAIGLGVGLGVAALLALLLGYKGLKARRRARRQNQSNARIIGHQFGFNHPEQTRPPSCPPYETQKSQLYEMDSRSKLAADEASLDELPGLGGRK